MTRARLIAAFALLAAFALPASAADGPAAAVDPGGGVEVRLIAGPTPVEQLQAGIISRALGDLGYAVNPADPTSAVDAHFAVGRGEAEVFTAHWDPLHGSTFLAAGGEDALIRRGTLVKDAIQGYLIDSATAEAHQIRTIEDLHAPENARLFDLDGNGKADLIGCPEGTACAVVIDHHIKACGLENEVEQVHADEATVKAAMARVLAGKPTLYYARVPHWSGAMMRTEGDVRWLMVPAELHYAPSKVALHADGVQTRRIGGQNFGFRVSQQRVLVNRDWARKHPTAARLFEVVHLESDDVVDYAVRLYQGKTTPDRLKADVDAWIAANTDLYAGWLKRARAGR